MNLFSSLSTLAALFAFGLAILAIVLDRRRALNRRVCASALVYGFWAYWSAFSYAADSPVLYQQFLHLGLVGYLAGHLTNSFAILALIDVHGAKAAGWMVPPVLWTLVQAVQLAGGLWIIDGFVPSVWGAVGIPSLDPWPWLALRWGGLVNALVGVVLLVRRWRRLVDPKARVEVAAIGLVLVLHAAAAWFAAEVLWKGLGWPDPMVLCGLIPLAGIFFLVVYHHHLAPEALTLNPNLLAPINEPAVLVSRRGTVLFSNHRFAQLHDRGDEEVVGRAAADVFPNWPGLVARLESLDAGAEATLLPEAALGRGRFCLKVHRIDDDRGEFACFLLRVIPRGPWDEAVQRYRLSPREREIAELLFEGLGTQEIADQLFIAPATVKNHLHHLFTKTETSNRVELLGALRPSAVPLTGSSGYNGPKGSP